MKPREAFKAAVKPAIFGWLVGLYPMLLTFACLFYILAPDPTTRSQILQFAQSLMLITVYSAMVVMPAYFIAGSMVCLFLPVGSRLWHPPYATIAGALCSAASIYAIGAILNRGYSLSDFGDPKGWFIGVVGAATGAACGYSLAMGFRGTISAVKSPDGPNTINSPMPPAP